MFQIFKTFPREKDAPVESNLQNVKCVKLAPRFQYYVNFVKKELWVTYYDMELK